MTQERGTRARRIRVVDPIPEFKTREEEAEFWDTHDLADYWDQWKPVKIKFAKNLSEGITVRFEPETLAELRRRAKAMGIGPTTLVRMWVMERMASEKPQAAPPPRTPNVAWGDYEQGKGAWAPQRADH